MINISIDRRLGMCSQVIALSVQKQRPAERRQIFSKHRNLEILLDVSFDTCILDQAVRNCNENQGVVHQRRDDCGICRRRDVRVDAVHRRPYGSAQDFGRNKNGACNEATPQDEKGENNDAVPVVDGA